MVMQTKTPQGARLNPQNTLELSQGMSIQVAIDTADAHGGNWTILLYPGAAYNEGDLTPNGGADITIKGMGEGRVVIAPVAAPATAVIVSGFNLILEDVIVTAPDATMPALRVTGGACEARDCELNGVGAGDAIQQVGGTLHLDDSDVPVGDVDLSTGASILTAVDTNFGGTLDTAGVLGHTIIMSNCDFGGNALNLAATGACTTELMHCADILAIVDASLVGTVLLEHTAITNATKAGTSPWVVRMCNIAVLSNTDATGAITVYAGLVSSITRAVGPIVWWWDSNTLKVIPSGTITDTVIQWAVNAAGAGDTVVIHPGTYEEAVTLAAGINLKGLDKEACIIDIDHATLVTMAAGCSISGLTLNATGDGTGNGIAVECNDAACTIEDCNINLVRTGNNTYGISEQTGGTARIISVRNVRISSDTDTNELALYCTQTGKTFFIQDSRLQGGDYGIDCSVASTFYVGRTHVEVVVVPPGGGDTIRCLAATMYFSDCTIEKQISVGNLGTVRLKNTSYREINRTGTGNIVDESPDLKDAPWHVQRWSWQATLAQSQVSVRGTPVDAGTGQVLLQVVDDVADVEAVESGTEDASALSNKLTPARTPRFITQIAVDSFDPHVTMFFGLRENLGDAIPGAAEDHAGFIWDGINFKSSSDDGTATQENNLAEPSTDALHQLEVIVFGGVTTVGWVEFYVDGILVATHVTRIPVVDLDWQHMLATAGGEAGDAIDITVRGGGVQQCPA